MSRPPIDYDAEARSRRRECPVVARCSDCNRLAGANVDPDLPEAARTALVLGRHLTRCTHRKEPTTMTNDELMAMLSTPDGKEPTPLFPTTLLRARASRLPQHLLMAALEVWAAEGYPPARTPEGGDVEMTHDVHRACSSLLRRYEAPADEVARQGVQGRFADLEPPEVSQLSHIATAHGIDNVGSVELTDGELFVVGALIDRLVNTRDARPVEPVHLEPLPERGHVISEPVADADALALVPPDGKVPEVMLWVNGDPVRARAAAEAERRRAKPRSSLLKKLDPLAGIADGAAPAPAGSPQQSPASVADDVRQRLAAIEAELGRALTDAEREQITTKLTGGVQAAAEVAEYDQADAERRAALTELGQVLTGQHEPSAPPATFVDPVLYDRIGRERERLGREPSADEVAAVAAQLADERTPKVTPPAPPVPPVQQPPVQQPPAASLPTTMSGPPTAAAATEGTEQGRHDPGVVATLEADNARLREQLVTVARMMRELGGRVGAIADSIDAAVEPF